MKRKQIRIPEDPVVAEVRRWRAQMVREAGGTLEGLIALLDRAHSQRKPLPKKHTRRTAAVKGATKRRKAA